MTRKNSLRGKKARAAGRRFELKVRAEMEKLGWVVSKWMNTVDYDKDGKIGKLVPCRPKFNPYTKTLMMNTAGFPDFICFKKNGASYEVLGLEVKGDGYLDQKEKGMCNWLIRHKIFSRILVAKKGKKRGEVEYVDFEKKYGKQ